MHGAKQCHGPIDDENQWEAGRKKLQSVTH
jgi:hypothetical protein